MWFFIGRGCPSTERLFETAPCCLAMIGRLGLRIHPRELVEVGPRQVGVVDDHQVLVVVALGAAGKVVYEKAMKRWWLRRARPGGRALNATHD